MLLQGSHDEAIRLQTGAEPLAIQEKAELEAT